MFAFAFNWWRNIENEQLCIPNTDQPGAYTRFRWHSQLQIIKLLLVAEVGIFFFFCNILRCLADCLASERAIPSFLMRSKFLLFKILHFSNPCCFIYTIYIICIIIFVINERQAQSFPSKHFSVLYARMHNQLFALFDSISFSFHFCHIFEEFPCHHTKNPGTENWIQWYAISLIKSFILPIKSRYKFCFHFLPVSFVRFDPFGRLLRFVFDFSAQSKLEAIKDNKFIRNVSHI